MTDVLRIGGDYTIPVGAVTETFAILAVKRAGKSNAAVVIAEEMYDRGLPWVAIDPKGDWWGVRADGDGESPGLSVVVFGGEHGDVPLEPTAGNYVADLIVDYRLTCVLDVSEMTKADQRRFLTDFATRLYRRNREPLHVFCEEADEYIPQMVRGEAAKLVGAFETLVKRGGFRGIGITLVTQRSASLNKDVLTQAGTLIAMRTTSPQDRKAVLAWIDYHAESKDVVDELPTLSDGEAYLFSPAWLRTLAKFQFRRRRTFDSGATPKIGGKPRPPARLADVDLAAIKEAMAETIERAKAENPAELRKEIAGLKRRLIDADTDLETAATENDRLLAELASRPAEPTTIDVPVLTGTDRELIEGFVDRWDDLFDRSAEVVNLIRDALRRVDSLPAGAKEGTQAARPTTARETPTDSVPTGSAPVGTAPVTSRGRPPVGTPNREGSGRVPRSRRDVHPVGPAHIDIDVVFSTSQMNILDTLAWFESVRIGAPTRGQVAFQAGVSPKSSGFEKNCSTLRTRGLIDYPISNRLGLTAAGRMIATPPSTPATSEALQAAIMDRLSESQRVILTVLIDVYPESLTREDLADRCRVSPQSSGFEKNCSTLRSLGLADYPARGEVAATEMLFIN